MTISSRTPEGEPLECPLCGRTTRLELCDPLRDATCPGCGRLLTWLAHRQENSLSSLQAARDLLRSFDSLDRVEVVMEMEEEFGISVPDVLYQHLGTPRDAEVFRALAELLDEEPPP